MFKLESVWVCGESCKPLLIVSVNGYNGHDVLGTADACLCSCGCLAALVAEGLYKSRRHTFTPTQLMSALGAPRVGVSPQWAGSHRPVRGSPESGEPCGVCPRQAVFIKEQSSPDRPEDRQSPATEATTASHLPRPSPDPLGQARRKLLGLVEGLRDRETQFCYTCLKMFSIIA